MAGTDKSPSVGIVAVLAVACLVALAGRLPGLGFRSLDAEEQIALVESQGLDPFEPIEEGVPFNLAGLGGHAGPWAAARAARVSPLHAGLLAAWVRLAGKSEAALRLVSVLAGVLAVGLVAWIGVRLAGPGAGVAAGLVMALSPLHSTASREATSGALWLSILVLSMGLLVHVEASGRAGPVLGLVAGLLLTGPPAGAAVGLLELGWLASRRRSVGAAAAGSAAAVLILATLLGVTRSPLAEGAHLDWVPAATGTGVLRCAGASFMRVLGIEYHQVVPQARYATPLAALVMALLAVGLRRLERRWSVLVLGGMVLPLLVGVILAGVTGRVTPLQAPRMLPAAPFAALAIGAGLVSLSGRRATLAGVVVLGSLGGLLVLTLQTPSSEASPTAALARRVAACGGGGAVTEAERRLDLLALAAWDVPGPLVLRSAPGPGPAIRVDPLSACTRGPGATCASLPACPSDASP